LKAINAYENDWRVFKAFEARNSSLLMQTSSKLNPSITDGGSQPAVAYFDSNREERIRVPNALYIALMWRWVIKEADKSFHNIGRIGIDEYSFHNPNEAVMFLSNLKQLGQLINEK
jgi:hypothetical protein